MTDSSVLAEAFPTPPAPQATGNKSSKQSINLVKLKTTCQVPDYKYKSNFPPDQIEELRRCMALERANSSEEDKEFFTEDFKRLMKDDWLVTRFLLRGFKASLSSCDENTDEATRKSLGYKKTLELVEVCGTFRKEYNVNLTTKIDGFPCEWIEAHGIFNYKPDLRGNPTMWLKIKLFKPKEISDDKRRFEFKRYFLYWAEQCDIDLFNRPGNCVCAIWDMTNATFENFDLEFISWMIKMSKLGPKFINYVIIYNLPWFLNTTFKLIANTFLSNGNHVVKFAYGNEIINFIAKENLPEYIFDQLNNK